MKIITLFLAIITFCPLSLPQDVKGSKDHPMFNRMPGYRIMHYKDREFDVYKNFRNEKGKKITVEGHFYYFQYGIKKGEKKTSGPQVLRNYMNAVKKAGGAIVYEEGCCNVYLKLKNNNQAVWVRVQSYRDAGSYQVWIVEEAKMEQDIVVNAKAMLNDLNSQGHIALYGIYFDFDKSEVKPESDPALKEIIKLLKENPSLNLYVVGHTDNVGDYSYNMKLSQSRAEAVVNILVSKYNVNKNRLTSAGVGPLSPIASNDTEEGKALNRRVELIKR
jgi:outer membrane protein OmpA-like peptidoglycan-associated protein